MTCRYFPGDRVQVELSDGHWHSGVVDLRFRLDSGALMVLILGGDWTVVRPETSGSVRSGRAVVVEG